MKRADIRPGLWSLPGAQERKPNVPYICLSKDGGPLPLKRADIRPGLWLLPGAQERKPNVPCIRPLQGRGTVALAQWWWVSRGRGVFV